jgi:DNA-binding NtrC family response regulator
MNAKYILRFNNAQCKPLQRQPDSCQRIQRILVVEDEGDLRQAMAELLSQAGYQVNVAENGAVAWSALRQKKYHLLFTDQFMPKMSGVRLLQKIHDARLTLPVIMATEFLPTWEFALHTWLQPVNMLLKPYSYDNLLDMVNNILPKTANAAGTTIVPPNVQKTTVPSQRVVKTNKVILDSRPTV